MASFFLTDSENFLLFSSSSTISVSCTILRQLMTVLAMLSNAVWLRKCPLFALLSSNS